MLKDGLYIAYIGRIVQEFTQIFKERISNSQMWSFGSESELYLSFILVIHIDNITACIIKCLESARKNCMVSLIPNRNWFTNNYKNWLKTSASNIFRKSIYIHVLFLTRVHVIPKTQSNINRGRFEVTNLSQTVKIDAKRYINWVHYGISLR